MASRKALSSQAGYDDVYAEAYPDFPRETRAIGRRGLDMLRVRQSSHETSDPAIDEIVFRLVLDASLQHSSVNCGDGRRDLSGRTGSLYVAPAGAIADWRAAGDHEILLLAVHRRALRELLGATETHDPIAGLYGRDLHDANLSQLMTRMWQESVSGGPGAALLVDGLFLTFLGSLAQHASRVGTAASEVREAPLDRQRFARVLEYIDAHLDQPLSVVDLAEIACMSSAHFSRCFKRTAQASPHSFVLSRRIERARARLQSSDDPLASIAYECGFSSQPHFTKQFGEHVGVTPGAYRKAVRS